MRISNMTSASGNTVPNQFIVVNRGTRYFQSYESMIAKVKGETITLDKNYWDYSRTTSKYRNEFLGMNTGEIKAAIEAGEIKLKDLNK